jgi:hypothetical protein
MTRQRIRRGVFHSIADLQASSTPKCDDIAARLYPRRRHLTRQAEERAHLRAYRLDVMHFMTTLGIASATELRQADHKAVIT